MKARIHPSTKSSTQSGRARTGKWLLAYESEDRQRIDPLTGWTGSADTQSQVTLKFDDLDAAIAYATAKGIDFEVIEPGPETLKLQAYADNFR